MYVVQWKSSATKAVKQKIVVEVGVKVNVESKWGQKWKCLLNNVPSLSEKMQQNVKQRRKGKKNYFMNYSVAFNHKLSLAYTVHKWFTIKQMHGLSS